MRKSADKSALVKPHKLLIRTQTYPFPIYLENNMTPLAADVALKNEIDVTFLRRDIPLHIYHQL